jgi:hypothetical protein
MVGVITAVLAGSEVGLAIAAAVGAPAAALASGCGVGLAALVALIPYQHRAWSRAGSLPITEEPAAT